MQKLVLDDITEPFIQLNGPLVLDKSLQRCLVHPSLTVCLHALFHQKLAETLTPVLRSNPDPPVPAGHLALYRTNSIEVNADRLISIQHDVG
ncbi:hypothetical protein D3C81_1825500 [compost metagenome]